MAAEHGAHEGGAWPDESGARALGAHAFADQLENDRVGQSLERGIDDVGRYADRKPPFPFGIAAFDQNAGGGSRSAIEDTDLVVGKFKIVDETLILAEILSQ